MVYRSKNRKKYKQGSCVQCGGPTLEWSKSFCEDHWFWYVAYRALGTGKKPVRDCLKKMFYLEQEGKCYFTGKELVLGLNASIDHLVPLSRGGKKDISNVRFVDLQINNDVKGSLTESELLDIVELIYKNKISQK